MLWFEMDLWQINTFFQYLVVDVSLNSVTHYFCLILSYQWLKFFLFFYYIIMYILNIANAIKKWQLKNSETLYMRSIISDLNCLKETVIIQWNVRKKDLLSFATKLLEKNLTLVIPKNTINLIWGQKWWKNQKQIFIVLVSNKYIGNILSNLIQKIMHKDLKNLYEFCRFFLFDLFSKIFPIPRKYILLKGPFSPPNP